jgi:hypothetical protein
MDTSHAPVSTPQVRVHDITGFVLSDSVRMPAAPARAPIYTWVDAPPLSLDHVRAIARRFGFDGMLYTAPRDSVRE